MIVHTMSERVQQFPSIDWSRRLFDALIPLPEGTSYNAYLIKGSEKTALIDTTEPHLREDLLSHLESIPQIDYLISNHAEQDHSGTIPMVLSRYAGAKLVCSAKAKPMLINLLHLPEDVFHTVNDGDTISLGDRTLEFILTPWVHWPETMVTYLQEEKTLFSCDFFGSHLATNLLESKEDGVALESAKRYYAEIMMPFARIITKNLEKLKPYDIQTIAPSHGPIYRNPAFIMDAYQEWIAGPPKNLVLAPYVSMHKSTQAMAMYLVKALTARGIEVEPFDLEVADIGKLAIGLVDAATIVLGTPTVIGGPHPAAAYAAVLTNLLRPKAKFFSIIGSYLWGSKAIDIISGLLSDVKAEVLEPVYVEGLPKPADYEALDRLADAIAGKHRDAGLM